jgi:hypothetical protein
MKARHILGHLFFAYLSFLNLIVAVSGIDEFGAAWLWLALFFISAFLLGLQSHLLWTKFFTTK